MNKEGNHEIMHVRIWSPELKSGRVQNWNFAIEKMKSGGVQNWIAEASRFEIYYLKNGNPDMSEV